MGTGSSTLEGLTTEQVLVQISGYFHSRGLSLRDAFDWLDVDRSGFVSWDEFQRGFRVCVEGTYGSAVHLDSCLSVFNRFDVNRDGRLSIDEFAAAFPPWTGFGTTGFGGAGYGDEYFACDRRPSPGVPAYGALPRRLPPEEERGKVAQEVVMRVASAMARTGLAPVDVFVKLDLDRSGKLSRAEFVRLLLTFQPDLSRTEQDAVFWHLDRDRSGELDLQEFARALEDAQPSALIAVEDKVKAIGEKFRLRGHTLFDAFALFDRDGDGRLARQEWQRVVGLLAPELSAQDAEAVFRSFDVDADGVMCIAEFQRFFEDAVGRALAAPPQPGALPAYCPPPAEEPWEAQALDLVRSCLSAGRTGMAISEVFRRLDIDGSGVMAFYEFDRMVRAYLPHLTTQHLEQLFYKVNVSASGAITRGEFIRRFG